MEEAERARPDNGEGRPKPLSDLGQVLDESQGEIYMVSHLEHVGFILVSVWERQERCGCWQKFSSRLSSYWFATSLAIGESCLTKMERRTRGRLSKG